MRDLDFGSLITAMATPFTVDDHVDKTALRTLVDHLLETGTTTVFVGGTTGESPTLTHEEKLRLYEEALRIVDGRVPVIAGTGSNSTKESITFSREVEQLGVQGLVLVAPYYNKPTQAGLYAHFETIAKEVNLPVMIYNVPGRTSVNIEADTVVRLAQIPNVVALKESGGNFTQIMHIAAEKPDDFLLYSGDDKYTLPMLSLGATGVVSVASHVVGSEMREMMDLFWDGQVEEAALWNARLLPIYEGLFLASSPAPLKSALELIGKGIGSVRQPLLPASEELQSHLESVLRQLGKC